MPSKPTPDRFLNAKEVAAMIGLHWTTVLDGRCGTNEIPRIKLSNKCVRFSFNAVQRWMEKKAREAEEDLQRERTTLLDLMSRQSRQSVKDIAQSIVNQERRRQGRL
jgi:predicted DNA-binding transcriptional regulator AlpA